ncbi:S8 family serine peptidase [Paludibacterium paludis]|uniref:Peptidase n=1 Tax=Paludibacterium paludis TaxID=1225769 RepID=A0A918UAG9_9NEIS|nr:S8 family serine peptidase [Paludibacterium paludis]GGY21772.1 peptidase [Paludibacterium paludis]
MIKRIACLAGLAVAMSAGAAEPMAAGLIVKYRDARGVRALALSAPPVGDEVRARAASVKSLARRLGSSIDYRGIIPSGALAFASRRPMKLSVALALSRNVSQDAAVEYAEPDLLLKPLSVSSHARFAGQWALHGSTMAGGALNVADAWRITRGGGVTVAVLDSGYRPHRDLARNVLPGHTFISDADNARNSVGREAGAVDPGTYRAEDECDADSPASDSNWHGTQVAGIIAANGAVAGVAPESRILPVRVLGRCGGKISDVVAALYWAAGLPVAGVPDNTSPARIVNLSLGAELPCMHSMRRAIADLFRRNVLVVAAAGNAARNARNSMPASCPGVLSVAASDRNGNIAYYSNYGAMVSMTAPGGDQSRGPDEGILVVSNDGRTVPGGDSYDHSQGTSMAAPHVAGVAALALAANPALTAADLRNLLIRTARPAPGACPGCSAGIVDAAAVVGEAARRRSGTVR